MNLPPDLFLALRRRAHFACEYGGVTEQSAGGLLSVDHIRPQSAQGDDTLENLAYACMRCNEYKAAYWPRSADEIPLFNPRTQAREEHFLERSDGTLVGRTPVGRWSIERLRLNRAPLVAHRRQGQIERERARRVEELERSVVLLTELLERQVQLQEEQQALLTQYHRWLEALLERET